MAQISAAQLRSVRTQKVRYRDMQRWADRAIERGQTQLAVQRAADVAECVRQKLDYHKRLRDDPDFLENRIQSLSDLYNQWKAVELHWRERKTGYDAPAFEEQAL